MRVMKGFDNMNPDKRAKYKLQASIHTATVRLTTADTPPYDKLKLDVGNIKVSHEEEEPHRATLNLNRTIKGDLFRFSEYKGLFVGVLDNLSAVDYYFSRIDMRFDSYDIEHYQAFAKLNRYIIALLAINNNSRNNYLSLGLLTQKQLSAVTKNRDFEAEHYDRYAKNLITGNTDELACSRLELRCKARAEDWKIDSIQELFEKKWIDRLYSTLDNVDKFIDVCNGHLYTIYLMKKHRYKRLSEFLIAYDYTIYSTRQMIDLLERIGVKDPKKTAYRYKERYRPEYISKSDVRYAIREIKRATKEYFSN